MPLTREQTKYVPSNDTVFLPTVAVDSNLGVRGNSVFDGRGIFNSTLNIKGAATFDSPSTFNSSISAPITYFNSVVSGFTIIPNTSGPVYLNSLSNQNQYILPAGTNRFVYLPNTSTLTLGQSFRIYQVSGGQQIGVYTSTGVILYETGTNNCILEFTCINTTNNLATAWSSRIVGFSDVIPSSSSSSTSQLFANNSSGSIQIGGNAGSTLNIFANLVQNIDITAKTSTYQLTTSDANRVIQMSGAFNFTVDTSLATLPLGSTFTLVAQTAGVAVAATANATVPTINATPGLKLRAAWSTASLIKMSNSSASGTASTWLLTGDLTA